MSEVKIQTYQGLEALSRGAAEHFATLATERAREKRIFSVALSGGKTPETFFRLLAGPEFAGRIPWENTHLFQVDERCVAPDDAQSNYRMIREALLSSIPAAAGNFHRMRAEQENRDAASEEYAAELVKIMTPPAGQVPRFDLIFLGMGPDGHTASLFPGTAALGERSRWVCPNYVEKFRMHRLTLTYPVLNAAAAIVFVVAGADKAEALRQVISGAPNPAQYPAQGVHPDNGKVTWLVDAAAAGSLDAAGKGAQ